MSKFIVFIFLVFFSLNVSAQESPILTFAKLPRSADNTYKTNLGQIMDNPFLVMESPSFTLMSYTVSILPKKGDLAGPYIVLNGELTDFQKGIMTGMHLVGQSFTIFLDDVKIKDNKMNKEIIYPKFKIVVD